MRGESFRNNIRNRKERREEMVKYPRIINKLLIYHVWTNKNTTRKDVWLCDINFHRIW